MGKSHGALVRKERSLITSASPESVWRIWSDTTTWPQWHPSVSMIQFNGFFDSGVKGVMTVKSRTRRVTMTDVVPEETFTIVTKLGPFTRGYYRSTIRPLAEGQTKISQSIALRGLITPIIGPMLRWRVARGFLAQLKGLAAKAESVERRSSPQAPIAEEYSGQDQAEQQYVGQDYGEQQYAERGYTERDSVAVDSAVPSHTEQGYVDQGRGEQRYAEWDYPEQAYPEQAYPERDYAAWDNAAWDNAEQGASA